MATLRRKLEASVSANTAGDRRYLATRQAQRQFFIERSYIKGGVDFLERVKKYGCTEKGERLRITPWVEEFLLLIGDFRVAHVLTTGPAQVGKTIAHTLLVVDTLTSGKLNSAWFYDSRTNLDQNVPMQFHPVADFWIAEMQSQGIRFRRGRDRSINTRYQVDQVNAIFSYVSTSRPSIRESGRAAAGGAAVSFQADWMVLEERSQYPPGAADPLPRRLDASMLPTRPIRELGTPGGGGGIEAEFSNADYYFYPHFQCEHCQTIQPLDPKGCLLQQTLQRDALGRPKMAYLSESGRPIVWFHEDAAFPVDTAYFACSVCGRPIPRQQRYEATFRCRYTGILLKDFLESLPEGVPERRYKVVCHLSPLLREAETNLASEIIRSGIDAATTDDWQQQRLGHPSETQAASISLQMLTLSMQAPRPEHRAHYRLAGIDLGRTEDWLVIIDFYLPDDYPNLKPIEIMERSIRVLRYGADVVRDRIPLLLAEFGVEHGLVDNEPSRESAMKLCRETCLEMGDQIAYLKDIVSETEVWDGGIAARCWLLRNEKFMNTVLEGFLLQDDEGHPLYRLPNEWERWIGNPSERSPLVHLMGPWRDANGQWHRGKGNVDDFFMACLFAETAFYIQLLTPPRYYSASSAASRPISKVLSEI
jgi:hypothetical protein